MPEHYHYEEYHHRRRRDDSPEYSAGGAGGTGAGAGAGAPRPYDPDYHPFDSNPRINEPYVREELHLEPIPSNIRPRSVPPPNTAVIHRPRPRSPTPSSSRSSLDRDEGSRRRHRSPSPVSKARTAVQDNFTNSTAGIGASLLGAVVGGFVARQASDAVSRRRNEKNHRRRRSSDYRDDGSDDGNTTRVVSTLIGAVAGGLSANALANRFEDSRDRDRAHQHAWERRHGREEDLPHYDTGRASDLDHKNGRGLHRDSSDDEYDHVYDDPRYDDRRPRRRRSNDDVRYRP